MLQCQVVLAIETPPPPPPTTPYYKQVDDDDDDDDDDEERTKLLDDNFRGVAAFEIAVVVIRTLVDG